MSGDEVFVTIISTVITLGGWGLWVIRASSVVGWPSRRPLLQPLAAYLTVAALVIFLVIRYWSDAVVQVMPSYQFMYFILGIAWLKVVEFLFSWGGLSVRDDVMERGNAAAVPAIGGAMIGVACAYSGGNIGDGPGWWVVVAAAMLSMIGMAGAWSVFTGFTRAIDSITIDRDLAAGVRFGALMLACGAIAGRAVAGDWHGIDGMSRDFLSVAPAMFLLVAIAIVIERSAVPTRERPQLPVVLFGVVPALLYVGAAAALLFWLGAPK